MISGTTNNFISRNIFLIGSLLVIIIFLITRLPYYLHYSFLKISFDSASYCVVAFNILDLKTPLFEIRTPGYPVFLAAVWLFSKTMYCVSLMQSLFTLFTSIFFLWVINKYYKKLLLLFAISLSVYISSSFFLALEPALLTEGLFVNLLILTTAFLIMSLKENKISYWILFSSTIAVTIVVRPAGLFLVSLMILIALYFVIRKYNFKYYASLVLPFTGIIISLCAYNYVTLRSFTITPFGESNMSGVTITFMEPSPEYPEFVNDAINEVLSEIPKKDGPYVRNSFGVTKLYDVFLFNYHRVINLVDNIMAHDSTLTYTEIQPMIRKIYVDAIKKYPGVYGKFVLVNFIQFFRNVSKTVILFDESEKSYRNIILEKRILKKLEEGGWQQVSSNPADYENVINFYRDEIESHSNSEYVTVLESGQIEIRQTFLKTVYEFYEQMYNLLFRNIFWTILFGFTFVLSTYRLVKSKFSDTDAFIFFLIGMMFLSKALMVSLVECSLERYSYTVEFAYYFSLPFLILFLRKPMLSSETKPSVKG